jgi:hypothetical protein
MNEETHNDPCLAAFEEWMEDRGIIAEKNIDWSNGIFRNRRVEDRWEGFICAWGLSDDTTERDRLKAEVVELISAINSVIPYLMTDEISAQGQICKKLRALAAKHEPKNERCPTCGDAVASIFDHVDRDGDCSDAEQKPEGGALKRESISDGTLPKDVHIGAVVFKKGVKLDILINAARRWYTYAQTQASAGMDVEAMRNALTPPHPDKLTKGGRDPNRPNNQIADREGK